MAHAIKDDMFLSRDSVSVWHREGFQGLTEDMGAWEGADYLATKFDVNAHYDVSLHAVEVSGSPVKSTHRMIVRGPISANDQEYVDFGIVTPDYHLITPDEAYRIWDEHVALPIDTMGVLFDGKALFICTKMPTFDIKGDEVNNHLVFVPRFSVGEASTIQYTSVQAVCANTVQYGWDAAISKMRLIHDSTIKQRTIDWLQYQVSQSVASVKAIEENARLLAATDATQDKLVATLLAAYPPVSEPVKDCPPDVWETRFKRYELMKERHNALRIEANNLFEGAGVGSELVSRHGTMWGVISAVSELENYRTGGSKESRGQSVLVGSRGDTIARATSKALELCQN